jgi:superfamily II DNA or RNA helicase
LSLSENITIYIHIGCEPSIAKEISQHFSFELKGAKFSPAARKGHWDGMIRLFNARKNLLYAGLRQELEAFCFKRGYEVYVDDAFQSREYSTDQSNKFFHSLNIPPKFEERDFQIETLTHAVQQHRALFLSPTGSGKSMSIYLLTRYFDVKTLIVVPTSNLLLQMKSDIQSYGYQGSIGLIGDSEFDDSHKLTISTWQSIYERDPEWFAQFGMVIVDEAHLASAKSLKGIMEKLPDCQYRFGFTGTLNGTKTHQMILEGLFGPVKKVATTKELIDRGILAPFQIKVIKLSHPAWARKWIKKNASAYPDEMKFLTNCNKRNSFLVNLALAQKGNTLLLFYRVEEHGKILLEMIQKKEPNRKVYYIHGKIKAEDRERIRHEIENSNEDCILVASYGTLSTGVNIKRLDNLIFGSPWKSQIINLQSIGRILRPLEGKTATLFDVSDDLSWKSRLNHTLKHLIERLKIYNIDEFDYKLFDVDIQYKEEVQ